MIHVALLALLLSPVARGAPRRIECNLGVFSKAERARQLELIALAKAKVAEMRETVGGYAFRYPSELFQQLAEWAALESKCCPAVDYQVEMEARPGGSAWLRLGGDAEVKEFIRAEFGPLIQLAPVKAGAERAPIPWLLDESQAAEGARRTGKPILIDFRADWCAACKMLDTIWADAAVRAEASRFVPLRLDLTAEDEAAHKLERRYSVSALPLVLAGGRRIEGFVKAGEMLEALRAAR